MILLTSADSRTQRHVAAALAPSGVRLRGFGRSVDAASLAARGIAEAHRGDLLDRDALDRAMQGIETVIHLGPGLQDKETTIGQFVIDAARSAGVARFIYISVIHPQIDYLMNHRAKLVVEDYLISSRLTFTILQPQHYFQNISVRTAVGVGRFALPYSMDRELGFVDMRDLGEAAAIVATRPGHEHATYEIASSEHLSGHRIAAVISEIAGVPVVGDEMTIDHFIDNYAKYFESDSSRRDWTADAITRLFTYYNRYGIRGNANVLSWLLDRPPSTFEDYVRRELQSSG